MATAKQLTFGLGAEGFRGVSWAPDSRIVYSSAISGNLDIWEMNADGSSRRQLTADSGFNGFPQVSSDGRYIVFVSDRSGNVHIWRMDQDGDKVKQLTSGSGETDPNCSPDAGWVLYNDLGWPVRIWKVPIQGGVSVQLSSTFGTAPSISADGKMVAIYFEDPLATPKQGIAIVSSEGGRPAKIFDTGHEQVRMIRWNSESTALMYIKNQNGISNIWSQHIMGGSPIQVTQFTTDQIFWFDISRDGTQLVMARGVSNSDVVLMRDRM
jgi:TolB protein